MKYLTYALLAAINASSVRAGRNRNLYLEKLPIDQGALYPVYNSFIHNDSEIRVIIVLNERGDTAYLDMSFDEFDALPQKKTSP